MWEIQKNEPVKKWMFLKDKNSVKKWIYGVTLQGYSEIVVAKPLKINTIYYFDAKNGAWGGGGCFYLNELKKVISSDMCSQL